MYYNMAQTKKGGFENIEAFLFAKAIEDASVFGGKKRCEWMKKGHRGYCEKKCKDGPFCYEHLQKIAAGSSLRFPCVVCLAGIKDSIVCGSCRIEEKVIEFEKDHASVGTYWWHYKKQQ